MSTHHTNLRQFIKRYKRLLPVVSLLILTLLFSALTPKADTSKETLIPSGSRRGFDNGLQAARGFRAAALRGSAVPALADDKFTFGPSQVTPGSTRQFTVTISEAQCKNNQFESTAAVISAADLKTLKDNNKFDISNPVLSPDRCTYSAVLKVGSDAPFDKVAVTLHYKETSADGKTTVDRDVPVFIQVVKEEAVPPGPLVPGLDPQVDIMWTVVPQNVVKDNFGQRVGKLFYCLEVVIGNDSGYNLQIATVGFQLGPTGPEASIVLDSGKSMSESLLKAQQDSLPQALKVATDSCKKEFKTYDDYKAYLDCVSNKTTQVITDTANSQAAVIVALQRQRDLLATIPPNSPGNTIPSASYRMTRGSVEHGQFWNYRNVTVNLLRAFGPFLTGFTPYFHNINHQSHYSEAINIISNPLEKGFEIVIPDETIQQLQRLDEQTLRDGMIILNNQQIRTRVFIPKGVLKLDKRWRDDPRAVTMSLGKLHIIGDLIEYKNRVSITTGATSGEVIPPPTVNPQPFIFNLNEGKPETISMTGTSLKNAKLEPTDADITISPPATTDTSLTAQIEIKDTAALGAHTLNLTNASRTIPITITVNQPPPTDVALVAPTPSIVSLSAEKKSYTFNVKGRFLGGADLIPIKNAGKDNPLTHDKPQVSADKKSFSVKIDVPENTPAGEYLFLVANERHTEGDLPKITVTIAARAVPSVPADGVTADAPVKLNPLKAVPYTLTITGTNLNGVTKIDKCNAADTTDLDLSGTPKLDGDKLKVTVVVPKNKKGKTSLKLVDLEGKSSNCFDFEIKPQDKATVNADNRSVGTTALPNGNLSVTINGENLEAATATVTAPDGWVVVSPTKDTPPNTNPKQMVVEIKPPAGWTAAAADPKSLTLKIVNTNEADPPAQVEVKLKP
jgi:hypothetical protein